MKIDNMLELSSRLDRILDLVEEWDIEDYYAYSIAMTNFYEEIKPIIEKYDPQESFKFEIRRLDDLRKKGEK